MKIISQSTVAHSPAYFHLAYLAATQTVHSRGLLGGGMLGMFLGCVLALRLVRRHAADTGKGRIALELRNNHPGLLLAGLVCVVLGTVVLWFGFTTGETRYVYPEGNTEARMHSLARYIQIHLAEGEPIPQDMVALTRQWELSESQFRDAWSNEIRLSQTTTDEGAEYRLVSAGKDTEFGTDDDLVVTVPSSQKGEDAESGLPIPPQDG